MPKASAPNAPWVLVWLSPQTMVMPGWVSPSCGPMMWTMPCSTSPSGWRRTPNSSALRRRVSTWVRLTGSAIGLSRSTVGTLWSSVARVRSGRRTLPPGEAQPVEGLRGGDLVDQVEVDVEEVGLPLAGADDVLVPDLLGQRAGHALSSSGRSRWCPRAYRLAIHNPRRQYCHMDNTSSGVGVLDKAALVLTALESGPATLAGLVAGTGLARPTAHRLAVALEHHRLVARDMQGRFVLGPRLAELSAAAGEDRLLATAGPVLARLRDITGESAQLWRRQGDHRVCVAAAERPSGLRDTIPVGTQLTMNAGSAAQVLLAWEDPDRMQRGLQNAAFSAAALSGIRRRGWAQSVGEREQGVASVSAPVRSPGGKILAAVSVSGPLERLSRQPGRMHAPAVLAAAERLSESLRRAAAAAE